MSATDFLTAALYYADRGWPVFPCVPLSKRPITDHGFLDATTDAEVIRKWWTRWPMANVGIRTGPPGVDVLDVDVRATGSGMGAMERLRNVGLLSGAIRIVRTPSGGLHVYFPASGLATGSIHSEHLDFRATGGCAVAPPSFVSTADYEGRYVLEDERRYSEGSPLDWLACKALLEPPRPVRNVRPFRGKGDIRPLLGFVAHLAEGHRNRGLFWAACKAVEAGHDPHALEDAAIDAGLDPREARATCASALRKVGAR
jgi:hypothetical protein